MVVKFPHSIEVLESKGKTCERLGCGRRKRVCLQVLVMEVGPLVGNKATKEVVPSNPRLSSEQEVVAGRISCCR